MYELYQCISPVLAGAMLRRQSTDRSIAFCRLGAQRHDPDVLDLVVRWETPEQNC
jgi:hypothetical protein